MLHQKITFCERRQIWSTFCSSAPILKKISFLSFFINNADSSLFLYAKNLQNRSLLISMVLKPLCHKYCQSNVATVSLHSVSGNTFSKIKVQNRVEFQNEFRECEPAVKV